MKDKKNVKDLKKAFFEIKDTKMEEIDLSKFSFPGKIFTKTISMKAFMDIRNQCTVLRQGVEIADAKPSDYELSDDFIAHTIAASVCDENGTLIFDPEDAPNIYEKSKSVFEILQNAVSKMNAAITEEQVNEKEKK